MIDKQTAEERCESTIVDLTAIEDSRLSPIAHAIHTYVMAQPDDYDIQVEDIADSMGDRGEKPVGKTAVGRGLNQLKKYGYYERYCDSDGRFSWTKIMHEVPQDTNPTN